MSVEKVLWKPKNGPFVWLVCSKKDYCCIILGYLGHVLLRKGVWSSEVRGCTCIVLEDPQWTLLKEKSSVSVFIFIFIVDNRWSFDQKFYLGPINKATSGRRMKTSNIHFILWTWEYSHKLHIRNSVYLIHTRTQLCYILTLYTISGCSIGNIPPTL